jgi:hypothetical protein
MITAIAGSIVPLRRTVPSAAESDTTSVRGLVHRIGSSVGEESSVDANILLFGAASILNDVERWPDDRLVAAIRLDPSD